MSNKYQDQPMGIFEGYGETVPNVKMIDHIFKTCLFDQGKDITIGVKIIDGIARDFVFDAKRIEEYKGEILAQIEGLPKIFFEGSSFLNACLNRDGEQWTGDHRSVEQLVVLGIAIGKIEYCLPKMFWVSLPGGVPYFQVKE